MHPRPEEQEKSHQARQTPLQAPLPDRDHVRQAQGLAARCNPIRQMPDHLPLSHRVRSNRTILALKLMSLEPTFSLQNSKQEISLLEIMEGERSNEIQYG